MTRLSSRQAHIGEAIPPHVREPTEVQLFAFSAATWNMHRIHYDRAYARAAEGYPDLLVQSHLHACFLAQAIAAAFGTAARLAGLGWRNRGVAVPGDRLIVTGSISKVEPAGDTVRVSLALEERNQRDELCVKGWATVLLPEDRLDVVQ
jgi:hydroxyacyl-ACP dehydratase HTD2-like protein with hotdog domain